MPTVHRQDGFQFVIYVDDHEPVHVHVRYAGTLARIRIGDADHRPTVVDPGSMRTPDIRKALRIVEARQEWFIERWKGIHGA